MLTKWKKFLTMNKQKKGKKTRTTSVFSPSKNVRSKTVQIEYKDIITPIHWTEDDDGKIQIDEDLIREEFEDELERIIFLANIEL